MISQIYELHSKKKVQISVRFGMRPFWTNYSTDKSSCEGTQWSAARDPRNQEAVFLTVIIGLVMYQLSDSVI